MAGPTVMVLRGVSTVRAINSAAAASGQRLVVTVIDATGRAIGTHDRSSAGLLARRRDLVPMSSEPPAVFFVSLPLTMASSAVSIAAAGTPHWFRERSRMTAG